MTSTLLFDFGGTLDSDGGHWLDRFWAIYERHGLGHIAKDRIKAAFYEADVRAEADPAMRQAGFRAMMEAHVRWQFELLGLQDPEREKAVAEAFWRPSERILHRNVHILETLAQKGFRMGVISNFYGNVETLCQEAGIARFFEVILDSAVVGLRKPDPAFYRLAAERLKTPPARMAMIGDSFERDIIPARALGMKTFWMVGDRPRTPPDPTQVDAMLHSLEDLPPRLAVLS